MRASIILIIIVTANASTSIANITMVRCITYYGSSCCSYAYVYDSPYSSCAYPHDHSDHDAHFYATALLALLKPPCPYHMNMHPLKWSVPSKALNCLAIDHPVSCGCRVLS